MRIRNLPTLNTFELSPSRLFDEIFETPFASLTRSTNDMEMYQEGSELVVKLQAPGFKEENIEITLDNRVLSIEGKVSSEEEKEDKDRHYYFKSISKESFTKSVQLPGDIDEDSVTADYKDGEITIRVQQKSDSTKKIISLSKK
ncbi:MAG: Hsp20/alpha crystallin family protein [Minisyncoccia bacterium]